MIAIATGAVFIILNGSKVKVELLADEKNSGETIPPLPLSSQKERISETGVILCIVVCVFCLILALVASSFFFRRDSKRSKKRQQLLTEIETQLNELSRKNLRKTVYKFIKN